MKRVSAPDGINYYNLCKILSDTLPERHYDENWIPRWQIVQGNTWRVDFRNDADATYFTLKWHGIER